MKGYILMLTVWILGLERRLRILERRQSDFLRERNIFEREKPKQNQKNNQLLTIFHSYAHKKKSHPFSSTIFSSIYMSK
jgi:hypothetical protein